MREVKSEVEGIRSKERGEISCGKELGTGTTQRTLWFCLALATAILVGTGIALAVRTQPGGQVEGSVFAQVEDKQFPLSGIRVYVENVSTSTLSRKVKTDLNGRFVVPKQPSGTYQLCWKAPGFVAECDPALFDIDNSTVFLSPIEITPKGGVVSGRITLSDGTPCHYFDPFFEVDVSTYVTLVDGIGAEVAGPVLANPSGDYLLTNVPSGTFRLRGTCEDALAEETLTTSKTATLVEDLIFDSHRPVVSNVVAILDGQAVQGAPAGTTVEVTANAEDVDGDPIHYKWATVMPGLTSENSPTIQWTLPKSRGLHTLYVMVSDGKGGYQMGRVEVSTDEGVVSSTEQSRTALAQSSTLATSSLPSDSDKTKGMNHFLTFNNGSPPQVDDRNSACAYYKKTRAIPVDKVCDPSSISQPNGITFNRWKTENGLAINPDFNLNGNLFDDDNRTGEASAIYLNAVDLDLGRSMHGKSASGKVAYYVCNHKTLKDARRNRNRIACVAMDYSVVPGVNSNKPFTRFYIFGPGGDLHISVELDGRGEKFMPGVCTVCHGTNDAQARKPFAGNADIGGRFLPFDLDNFRYLSSDPSSSFSRDAQQSKFKRLNEIIRVTDIAPVVKQLIDGWYRDGRLTQDSGFVPSGWDVRTEEKKLYLNVVKASCRTCHVVMRPLFNFNRFESLDTDDTNTPPNDTQGGFKNLASIIRSRTCSTYEMPNSKVTFDRFWLSKDTQPGILAPEELEKFLGNRCPDPLTVP